MYEKAVELAEANGWFLAHQFETKANAAIHEATTAREILDDFAGSRLDYFVTGYGTGGTVVGVGRVLRRERPGRADRALRAGERGRSSATGARRSAIPDGSPAASHPAFEPHPIQGWTPDFIPDVLQEAIDAKLFDEVVPVVRRRGHQMGEGARPEGGDLHRHLRRLDLRRGAPHRRAGAGRLGHPLHASRHRRTLHDDAAVRRHRSRDERGGDGAVALDAVGAVRSPHEARKRQPDERTPPDARAGRETLDPDDWSEALAVSRGILDDAVAYLRDVRDRPVWREMPADVRASFDAPLPRKPEPLAEVYREVAETVMAYPMGNIHPRFWAWYMGSSNFTGAIGDFLAAIQGSNLGGGNHAAALMDRQVVDWLKEMVGFPALRQRHAGQRRLDGEHHRPGRGAQRQGGRRRARARRRGDRKAPALLRI